MGREDITLYANWTTNNVYTVTFDKNDSDSGDSPDYSASYYQEGDTPSIPGNGTLAKYGHIFDGWNTERDGGGRTYGEGESYTIGTVNVTLYATWIDDGKIEVSYDGNGNNGGTVPAPTRLDENKTFTIPGNTGNLVRTGFFFRGWNTEYDGSSPGLY